MTTYTSDKATRDLKSGDFKSIGKYFTGVSDNGGSVAIVLENNSDYDLFIPALTVRSEFGGRIEKGFNATVDTSDTNLSFTNKKSGGSHSASSINAFSAGDGQTGAVTLDGTNFNDKELAADTATSPGTQASIGGNILASGDNLVVRAVNESAGEGSVSIDLDFIKMNGA